MTRKIRFGVIGCGGIAQAERLPVALTLRDITIEAVCDVYESVAEKIGKIYHAKHYVNYNTMLDDTDLDAVAVCTPDDLHVPVSMEAIKRGISVICEKPISRSVSQARRLCRQLQKSSAKFMVAYMKRYDPGIRYVEKLLDNEVIGVPITAVYIFRGTKRYYEWRNDLFSDLVHPKDGEMPAYHFDITPPQDIVPNIDMLFQGCHVINLLRALCGEVRKVVAAHSSYEEIIPSKIRPQTSAILKHKGGCTSVIIIQYGPRVSWDEQLSIQCTAGAVDIYMGFPHFNEPAKVKIHTEKSMYTPDVPFADKYVEEYRHFLSCLHENKSPKTGAEDGLRDIEVIREIIKKAH
jgi:predicted dehydrogenase